MTLQIGTHSGSFHADDVMAVAMIRSFVDASATVVRTRDPKLLDACDLVVDVGSTYDPAKGRFDHHQNEYTGLHSSAGMVLNWLESSGKIEAKFASILRSEAVDYIDAVDNGRRTPEADVPCFASITGNFNNLATDEKPFDHWFLEAVSVGQHYLQGLAAGYREIQAARSIMKAAMDEAVAAGRAVIFLDQYTSWKSAYFEQGGVDHPTDFILFPGDDKWRVVAIPPEPRSFDKKRPFPESWAGLENEALSAVTGVPGSVFCHKNRFIAVFDSRQAAIDALERWDMMTRPS